MTIDSKFYIGYRVITSPTLVETDFRRKDMPGTIVKIYPDNVYAVFHEDIESVGRYSFNELSLII